jgi:HIV Tat-specific factor 1
MPENWWICDHSGHRRGGFTISQIAFLLDIGTLNHASPVCENGMQQWSQLGSTDSITNALAKFTISTGTHPKTERLPIGQVPPIESIICSDPTCSKAPSCDVVYIWDRKEEIYLTYDEYVKVCIQDGLNEGLPERALAQSADQVQSLLFEADKDKISIPRKEKHKLQQMANEMNEAVDEPLSDPEKEAKRLKKRAYRERRKLKRDAGIWIKSKVNPNIYISGLPLDVTIEELGATFSKAGQLKTDIQTGKPKIRIYGHGDALVTYMHVESVKLAIDRFHESEFQPGYIISVQQADFQPESTDQSGKPISVEELKERAQMNREKRKKLLEFYKKERELKSAWDIAETTVTKRPIVVFSNAFDPSSVDYGFVENEIENFSSKFGIVKKINIIKYSIDGYVCVRFETVQMAEACLAFMDDALESGDPVLVMSRPVSAFMHDGRDLSSRLAAPPVDEDTELEQAIDWEEFLYGEVDSDDDDIQIRTE